MTPLLFLLPYPTFAWSLSSRAKRGISKSGNEQRDFSLRSKGQTRWMSSADATKRVPPNNLLFDSPSPFNLFSRLPSLPGRKDAVQSLFSCTIAAPWNFPGARAKRYPLFIPAPASYPPREGK